MSKLSKQGYEYCHETNFAVYKLSRPYESIEDCHHITTKPDTIVLCVDVYLHLPGATL